MICETASTQPHHLWCRHAITAPHLEYHPYMTHYTKCHKPAGNSRRLERKSWLKAVKKTSAVPT